MLGGRRGIVAKGGHLVSKEAHLGLHGIVAADQVGVLVDECVVAVGQDLVTPTQRNNTSLLLEKVVHPRHRWWEFDTRKGIVGTDQLSQEVDKALEAGRRRPGFGTGPVRKVGIDGTDGSLTVQIDPAAWGGTLTFEPVSKRLGHVVGIIEEIVGAQDKGRTPGEVRQARAGVGVPEGEAPRRGEPVAASQGVGYLARMAPNEDGRGRWGEQTRPIGEKQAEARVFPDLPPGSLVGGRQHLTGALIERPGCRGVFPCAVQHGWRLPGPMEGMEEVVVDLDESLALEVDRIVRPSFDEVSRRRKCEAQAGQQAREGRGSASVHADDQDPRSWCTSVRSGLGQRWRTAQSVRSTAASP